MMTTIFASRLAEAPSIERRYRARCGGWILALALLTHCTSSPSRDAAAADIGAQFLDGDAADTGWSPSDADAAPLPDHPGTDAGADVQPMDAISVDGGLPTCGDEFLSIRYETAGDPVRSLCIPLPRGVTTNAVGCVVREVSVQEGQALLVSVGGLTEITSRTGPSMIGVTVQGRDLSCGSQDGFCFYRTFGATCTATIVRSGQVGAVVEAVLSEPCTLRHQYPDGGVGAALTVHALRLHGRLRLTREITTQPDGAVPFADCGL
jgi:hypothetical protein